MELYVCYGTFSSPRPGGHPCGNAYKALKDAGYAPKVIKTYGLGALPSFLNRTAGRREVKKLTGRSWVPVLVTDDDEIIADSKKIVAWAKDNPATAAATARA